MRPKSRLLALAIALAATAACQKAVYNDMQPSPVTSTPAPGTVVVAGSALPTFTVRTACTQDQPLHIFCRLQATGRDQTDWSAHVVSSEWSWGDGTQLTGYLTGTHVYPERGTFYWSVVVRDDAGHESGTNGSVSVR